MINAEEMNTEENIRPDQIEKRSFEIISRELEQMGKILAPGTEKIVKRCIHSSADFDYADNLWFSEGSVDRGIEALRRGAWIVTDTNMARAGISAKTLEKLGGRALCFMADEDVAVEAREAGRTRASVSVDRALRLAEDDPDRDIIFAFGNAPTGLMRLNTLFEEGRIRPALVIACPVGFVNVVQAKEKTMSLDMPQITARGRKGGSSIAACIVNALMYMAVRP